MLIFEKMFESRLFFVDKLVSMGARIILCDPHRAVVTGPGAALRPADGEPRHPRRHGDAARGALRRGHVDDREHRARSTAATSGSTSACAPLGAHDRARRDVSALGSDQARRNCSARVDDRRPRRGAASSTGVPVLDHLLGAARAVRDARPRARGRAGERRGRGRRGGHGARRGAARGAARRRARRRHGSAVVPRRRGAGARRARGVRAGRSSSRTSTSSDGARRRPRGRDVVARFLHELAEGSRPDAARAADRGRGARARARGDLQGARRGARRSAAGNRRKETDGREERRPHRARARAVPGRAVLAGDPGGRARVRLRPARRCGRARRRSSASDRGADRADARQPARDPRGGGQRARPARQDDGLPRRPRRLRRA